MTVRSRRALYILLFVALVPVCGVAALLAVVDRVGPARGDLPDAVDGGADMKSGRFVGHAESAIVGRFGPPTRRWHGRYGNLVKWAYLDALSATYVLPTGTLYLSYCWQRGRLVCFESHWMPNGAYF